MPIARLTARQDAVRQESLLPVQAGLRESAAVGEPGRVARRSVSWSRWPSASRAAADGATGGGVSTAEQVRYVRRSL